MKQGLFVVLLSAAMSLSALENKEETFFCDRLYQKHQKVACKTVNILQSINNNAADKKVGDCLPVYRSIVQLLEPYSNNTKINTRQQEELERLHESFVSNVTQDKTYELSMSAFVEQLSHVENAIHKLMECGFDVQQTLYGEVHEYDQILLDVIGVHHRNVRIGQVLKPLMLPLAVRTSAQLLGYSAICKQKGLASLTKPGMSASDGKAMIGILERSIKKLESTEDTRWLISSYKTWQKRLQESLSDIESQEIIQACIENLYKNILPKVRSSQAYGTAFREAFKTINEADTALHELLKTVVHMLSQRIGDELHLGQQLREKLVDIFVANGVAVVPVATVLTFDKAALHVALGVQAIQMDIERRIRYILASPRARRDRDTDIKA